MNIRNLSRKLRGRGGFTVMELLACVLILLLSLGVVTDTLSLGIKHVEERSRDSAAVVLCDTLSAAVRDQLSCVTGWDGDVNQTFYSGASGLGAVPCRFEVGTLDDGEFTQAGAGELLLVYTDDTGDQYVPLIDSRDYSSSGAALKAGMTLSAEGGAFHVTLSVYDGGDAANALTQNTFTVTPVKKGVLP